MSFDIEDSGVLLQTLEALKKMLQVSFSVLLRVFIINTDYVYK